VPRLAAWLAGAMDEWWAAAAKPDPFTVAVVSGDDGRLAAAVLAAGEGIVGPLPTMRKLLAHRAGDARLPPAVLRAEFGPYLGEVERIVEAVDALDA